ncbi:hypothetical protein MNB_SUP05-SYMBIONT-4-131 [hydrothermal vent metagenome]|uniref:Uncharacterized protein n=1 Tax=hydrothermal vent metagenome TaxID=652676 RepID=A0A1W1DZW5_9ZZZZ
MNYCLCVLNSNTIYKDTLSADELKNAGYFLNGSVALVG